MDSGAIVLIVTIGIVVLLFSLFRGGGGVRRRPEVVQFLLFDVKINQALVETFHQRDKPKRFEKTNWEINKGKIGFLGEEIGETLRTTFDMVEEFNREIKQIRKNNALSHQDMNVSVLIEPLKKSREGLEGWLMDTLGTLDVPIRYPSLTGFLFGDR
jgi:hypothetical protein